MMGTQTNGGRRGTALVLVLALLGVVFAGVIAQHGAARYVSHQTSTGLAGAQALRTAHGLIDRAFAELAVIAATPAHPQYAELRRRLATAKDESVDLSDLVPAVKSDGALFWKRAKQAVQRPVGTVTTEPVKARAESFRRYPERLDQPSVQVDDERTGLLALEARVSVTLAGQTTSRTLVERRELKLVVAGPPRPFDQTALVVEELSALTDPERANQQRALLLTILDDTIAKIQGVQAQLAPDVASTLAQIQAAAPRPDQRERLLPRLPVERAGVVGLSKKGSVTFAWLDLAARLEEDVKELETLHRRVLAAAGQVGADGGRELLERVTASLSVYNRASTRIWEYQRLLKVFPSSGPAYQQVFGVYGPRLSATWYADRAVLGLDPKHPLFVDWTAGRRELDGVFEVKSATDLRIEGPRAGRTVLCVDAPAVELSGLTRATPGDLCTVVITRGRVRLTGRVDAYVIVDASARIEMAPGCELTGGLALRAGAGHQLAGKLTWSPTVPTGLTTPIALAMPGRGPYGLAFSPVPLYTDGSRQ